MYTLQIYFDFSGYSDMAMGTGRMLGFDFLENFDRPYVAKTFTDFWRRWHISLSQWLRDYLYIPLGGNRKGTLRTYANLSITMLLGGLWHGASWNFLVWGGIHGVGLAVEKMLGLDGRNKVGSWPLTSFSQLPLRLVRIAIVYALVHTAWVYFRAADFATANALVSSMWLAPLGLGRDGLSQASQLLATPHILFLLPVVFLHIGQATHEWWAVKKTVHLRVALCIAYLVLLCLIDRGEGSPFLYFQF